MTNRLTGRVISLEHVRAERFDARKAEREATTNEFFRRIAESAPPSTAKHVAEGDRAAAALIEYINNGGGGDEAA